MAGSKIIVGKSWFLSEVTGFEDLGCVFERADDGESALLGFRGLRCDVAAQEGDCLEDLIEAFEEDVGCVGFVSGWEEHYSDSVHPGSDII